jgi:hypothetical protein
MLSESATVAPLSPVPVGVCDSFDCEFERGMLRRERFLVGSPADGAPSSPAAEDLDAFRGGSSADAGPLDDDRGGGTTVLAAVDALATGTAC